MYLTLYLPMCVIVAHNLVVFVLVARVIINKSTVGESKGELSMHKLKNARNYPLKYFGSTYNVSSWKIRRLPFQVIVMMVNNNP